jgi:hypothetical protein
LAPEHGNVMAQGQQLDLLATSGTGEERHQARAPGED